MWSDWAPELGGPPVGGVAAARLIGAVGCEGSVLWAVCGARWTAELDLGSQALTVRPADSLVDTIDPVAVGLFSTALQDLDSDLWRRFSGEQVYVVRAPLNAPELPGASADGIVQWVPDGAGGVQRWFASVAGSLVCYGRVWSG